MRLKEKELLCWFEESIRELMPKDWRTSLSYEVREAGRTSIWDAVLALRAPDGAETMGPIEVRARPSPKDAGEVAARLGKGLHELKGNESKALILADYLSPRTRVACEKAGLGYADRTGAWHLQLGSPAVFIDRMGAQRNPNPSSRGIGSFRGTTAARVARALVDFRPPMSLKALGTRAGVSPGSVSKMLTLLEEESLVDRERRGPVIDADWLGIIQRWIQDYELERRNRASYFLSAKGIDASLKALSGSSDAYAITGAVAADRVLRTLPEPRLVVYAANRESLQRRMQLSGIDARSANVVLLMPYDERVLMESERTDGLSFAPWSQVLVDLLTGDDREPAAGENLMTWMEQNEDEWRRRSEPD